MYSEQAHPNSEACTYDHRLQNLEIMTRRGCRRTRPWRHTPSRWKEHDGQRVVPHLDSGHHTLRHACIESLVECLIVLFCKRRSVLWKHTIRTTLVVVKCCEMPSGLYQSLESSAAYVYYCLLNRKADTIQVPKIIWRLGLQCPKAPRNGRKKQQTFLYLHNFLMPFYAHFLWQKAKLKLGKTKLAPSNAIDTSFKARCASLFYLIR